MDFENYPKWNPFVKSISGEQKVGAKLKVSLPGMNLTPNIVSLKKQREFKWLGHFLFKGLFDGKHQFELHESGNGFTTLIHKEDFTGILVTLFKNMLDTKTKTGFEAMNLALKIRAEQTTSLEQPIS